MAGPRSCQVEPRCWGRAVNNPEGSPGPSGEGRGKPTLPGVRLLGQGVTPALGGSVCQNFLSGGDKR